MHGRSFRSRGLRKANRHPSRQGSEAETGRGHFETVDRPGISRPDGPLLSPGPSGVERNIGRRNGILGVQLRSGSNWINIMPAEAAASASEVVLHYEQEVAAQSNPHARFLLGRWASSSFLAMALR